jgi:hypothetical protein
MADKGKYLIWTFPVVKKRLEARYPALPLSEILGLLRSKLSSHANEGRQAPFPYAMGVRLLTFEAETSRGRYRVTPLYEMSGQDNAVEVLDVGVVSLDEGLPRSS